MSTTEKSTSTPPISFTRLKQIADDACHSALGSAEYYEHSKTDAWNTSIIQSILKSLISESSPASGGPPSYKYAVNSTIIQHLVPTNSLHKPRSGAEQEGNGDDKEKPHVGRRGMHSATGAFWNEKTDGMWSFKYDGGESKGLDVVISVIWIGI